MTDDVPTVSIAAVPATEHTVVERLLQLYLHDFSAFADAADPYGKVSDAGLFAYDHLDAYWHEPGREALLLWIGPDLAGFALVNTWSASGRGTDKAIAEFFVLRKYRRTGVGRHAACAILQSRPAVWEIAVAHYNQPAQLFWQAVIATLDGYTSDVLTGDDERWSGPIWRLTPDRQRAPAHNT